MTSVAPLFPSDSESASAQLRQFVRLLRSAPGWKTLSLFAVLIVAVIIVNAVAQIRLNVWQGDIYDALSKRELPAFYHQIAVFAVLVAILLSLGFSQTWLHEKLKVRLREALAFDLFEQWLEPKRAYRLPLAGDIGEHPDQRIQDDARRLTELSVNFAVGLVYSTLMLVSFIGVLWVLSGQIAFDLGNGAIIVPGYMVWAALFYATIGSYLTWLVGRPLIEANTELRGAEADFRFQMVHIDQNSEAIAIYRGEADELGHLRQVAARVFAIMDRIASRIARLHWVTGGYGWLTMIAPIVLAAPGYFSGSLSFGGLMMVVGAFFQVQNALRWYVDNFPGIAEWRATLLRVMSYRTALTRIETLGQGLGSVAFADHPEGKLSLDGLMILGPNGTITLSAGRLDVEPGERVLIAGTPRCGKTTFFRALAGLWVWGRGVLKLPRRGTLMFLPHRPYLPIGSLREALAYPASPDSFTDDAIKAALKRIGLGRLTPMLDKASRWEQELPMDEQQRIAFARALLHKPAWIVQDEAMSEMDEENRVLLESIFREDLAKTALISIGKSNEDGHFYDRIVTINAKGPAMHLPMSLAS